MLPPLGVSISVTYDDEICETYQNIQFESHRRIDLAQYVYLSTHLRVFLPNELKNRLRDPTFMADRKFPQ